jgi:nucleotide-binding universal stress UspA family protein
MREGASGGLLDEVRGRLLDAYRRARAIERREIAEFGRWVENTDNLLHLSVVVFVPLLIAVVTWLSNMVGLLPYLLFPPLASGSYTLFAQPESRYASPKRFVGGLTAGALCGWVAFEVVLVFTAVDPTTAGVNPFAAAGAIFLTGVVTWAADLEEASAFSSALLVLVTEVASGSSVVLTLLPGVSMNFTPRAAYVLSVLASTTLVATVFLVWREEFYQRRAHYLYGTTHGDDHVLVPVRGENREATILFGARIAAAHEAGRVVLLDILEEADLGESEVVRQQDGLELDEVDIESAERVRTAAEEMNEYAQRVRTLAGVPCEVVVATGDPGETVIDTAKRTNCDLIVTPYEESYGSLSPFVRHIFAGPFDAVAHRASTGTTRWRRVLVPVSRPGDSAHAMIDFATRLAGRSGVVSACTCIQREVERRPAERRLADMVEAFDGPIETRVARDSVTDFIEENADAYDLVMLGSSGDRSVASRFVSPPTFERLKEVDCDVAVVDRGQL